MERTEFLKLGAFCLERMSLKAQQALYNLAVSNLPFSGPVLSELNEIENGYDFVKACGGKLDVSGFWDILAFCSQSAINRLVTDSALKEAFLKCDILEGYFIRNNEAVYQTLNMEATLEWFRQVLGWPGIIEARDAAGNGTYGLIMPQEQTGAAVTRGLYLQLERGEPVKSIGVFMVVWGINGLRQRALSGGWKDLTPIEHAPWGASIFTITTCDGTKMVFCEPDSL